MKNGKAETETVYVRNKEKRDNFIKTHGQADFDRIAKIDPKWAELIMPECPKGGQWLWDTFISIWSECSHDAFGNTIMTCRDIMDYLEYMKLDLNVAERALMLKMKHWAQDEIAKLKDKE